MPRPNEKIGDYTFIKKLGKGQFGTVWLAEKERLDGRVKMEVAVKFVNDDSADFEKVAEEAKVWAKANGHTNVLTFYNVEMLDGQIVLVSEYARDRSLLEWIDEKKGGFLELEPVLRIVCGVLSGLEHLHSKKILHRDVKPANILLNGETPKLADFGISRVLRSTVLANDSLVAGTPAYMSPEAYANNRDFRSDIWSIGILLYQMLTNRLPFLGTNAVEMMAAIITQPPAPLPSEMHSELKEIIFCALDKDINKRYQSAQEMRQALERFLVKLNRPNSNVKLEVYPFQTVELSNTGKLTRHLENSARCFIENLGNNVQLVLTEIEGGDFLIGASEGEVGAPENEKPQHKIAIKTFFLSKFPITQAEWKAVMQTTPAHFKGDNLPVEQISWNDAVEFCQVLSQKTGREYYLPSEAQWEYAARAKAITPFAFGHNINPEIVNYDGNYPYGFMGRGEYRAKTSSVGSLGVANAFGLYDMHGNVFEWCQDVYHSNYKGIPTNGQAWRVGGDNNYRVIRGGAWSSDALSCRSAARNRRKADLTANNVGFRVACSIKQQI